MIDLGLCYFSEIENCLDLLRRRGTAPINVQEEDSELALESIERLPNYLENKVFEGSYNEEWSLRKVLRRFIWHDRIHVKSMYRMARKTFPIVKIANPYYF